MTLADLDAHPLPSDDESLKRHLRAIDREFTAAYQAGLRSQPRNASWEWYGPLHLAWIDGQFERNRRRQEAVAAAVYRLAAATLRLFCRRCRRNHPRAERRFRRIGRLVMRAVRWAQARRAAAVWADVPPEHRPARFRASAPL